MSDLQSRALLAKPSIGIIGTTRTDDELTEEVQSRHGTSADSGKYNAVLYPPNSLATIRKVASRARKYHKTMTVRSSFGDILPTALDGQYKARMDQFQREFNDAADAWSLNFASVMDECRRMHNGTFRDEWYPPSAAHARQEFSFTVLLGPVPRGEDLVVQYLSDDRIAELRHRLTTDVAAAGAAAGRQVMERVLERVQLMVRRLSDPDYGVRDSLITGLTEILDLGPALNLNNDPTVAALIARCREQLVVDADRIRASDVSRALVTERARAVVIQFGQVGRRLSTPEPKAA
jgi:hypothetical protein